MPVRATNRREDPRSRIPSFQDAEIEFTGPDGTAHTRPLIELSVSGGSFPEQIPGLEVGAAVGGGVLRVGEFEVRINFVVRRVTCDDGNEHEYGVQIYTMSDQDRNDMTALVSRLQRDLEMV
jgi:hypothetical protein